QRHLRTPTLLDRSGPRSRGGGGCRDGRASSRSSGSWWRPRFAVRWLVSSGASRRRSPRRTVVVDAVAGEGLVGLRVRRISGVSLSRLGPETVRLLQCIQPLRVTPEMPVFSNLLGNPIEPRRSPAHWYACLRALGIRRGCRLRVRASCGTSKTLILHCSRGPNVSGRRG